MIKYILKRFWQSGILALIMSLIVFFGMYVVGDPVEMLSDEDWTEQDKIEFCLLYTSPSPRDQRGSRMPSSA